jgi:hypothetical protein
VQDFHSAIEGALSDEDYVSELYEAMLEEGREALERGMELAAQRTVRKAKVKVCLWAPMPAGGCAVCFTELLCRMPLHTYMPRALSLCHGTQSFPCQERFLFASAQINSWHGQQLSLVKSLCSVKTCRHCSGPSQQQQDVIITAGGGDAKAAGAAAAGAVHAAGTAGGRRGADSVLQPRRNCAARAARGADTILYPTYFYQVSCSTSCTHIQIRHGENERYMPEVCMRLVQFLRFCQTLDIL